MKVFKRLRTILLSGCVAIASLCGALLLAPTSNVATAKAEGTIASNVYQTDGASVRVFDALRDEKGNISFAETSRQGIRFHVEMGVGYVYGGTTVIDTNSTNERNGSYKLAKGFKTYTLVLPTRLLSGDLTVSTDKVMKIDTSEYWFSDDVGNNESVAYIYNVPEKRYTDNFSYRGVICTVAEDGTETVVAQTNVEQRALAQVAKLAYKDTIKTDSNYWGSDDKDNEAAPLIKKFVPTYNITYKVDGNETTEEVLWGDAPQAVPTEGVKGAWYDTENNEEVKVSNEIAMNWTENRTLVLETTTSDEFVLTGVAAHANYNGKGGVKIYATLHSDKFSYNQELDIHAVNVEYVGTGKFSGLQGVWTMEDGGQMRLFFAFDSSKMVSGDKLIVKGDSIFYAGGVMYKLTEDYTIDYDGVDYGMFLGYLNNSHIKALYNAPEDTNDDGTDDEFTIRVEFYEDIMITDDFTFVNDDVTNPVYIQCGQDPNKQIPISGGQYYWNNGAYKILELIATGEYANTAYGWHMGDQLKGVAGTKLVQNGGYYIFEDEIFSEFVTSEAPEYERTGGYWTVGTEKAKYGVSEFAITGENVEPYMDGDKEIHEVRINTVNRWFDTTPRLSLENMSDTAPYAAYFTKADGTVKEITEIVYHGQDKPEGGNYQILGIRGNIGENPGDMITIISGSRLWNGNVYYTISADINLYFNGSYWITNFDKNSFGQLNASNFNGMTYNNGANAIRMHLTAPLDGLTTAANSNQTWTIGKGSVTMNGISYTDLTYYYFDQNTVFMGIQTGTASVSPVGIDLFQDTLVIEKGTTVWNGTVGYEFAERLEWRYLGYSKDLNSDGLIHDTEKRDWILVSDNNVNVTNSNFNWVSNDGSNGGEVRLWLHANGKVLNTDYYGEMLIDTKKPVIFNGNVVTKGFYYNQSNNMVSLVYAQGVNDGDYFIVPAGSVWWVTQLEDVTNGYKAGTVTFTEEIAYTYIGGNWVIGDTHAEVDITATNANISGAENGVIGNTYTFTVTPNSGYAISKVTVNGKTINGDNGTYSFTAEKTNTVEIETIIAHTITFEVAEGASVDNGAITNGATRAVVDGDTLTFTVVANEGYKLTGVTGATNNGNGTYTVTPTGNATVTITTEKLYKVTYANGTGYTIAADKANGTWLENGTTVTFTINATSGYVVTAVSGATKTGDNTYTATVNRADLAVTATTIATSALTDANELIGIENRSDWEQNTDNYYFGITNQNGTNLWLNTIEGYTGYWNDNGITLAAKNNGVDIMEYILIDGVSARELVTKNENGETSYKGTTMEPLTYGGKYAPITVETTTGSGILVRVLRTYKSSFEITIKAGFMLPDENNNVLYVSKDLVYTFDGSAISSKYSTANVSASYASVSGVTNSQQLTNGQEYTFTASAANGYQLTSVTINGAEQGSGGSYSFTASGTKVSIVVTAKKLYAVTWGNPTGATISVTANGNAISSGTTVVEGTSISVSVTANSGYTVTNVTANGTSIGTTSGTHTVSGATTITATTKKLYAVTWSNPTGATISVTANGNAISSGTTVIEGTSISVTATANSGYRLNTVTIGGVSQSGVNTSREGSSTFAYTVNAATSISATTVKMYTVSWDAGTGTTVTCNTSGLSSGDWVDNGTTVSFTINLESSYKDLKVNDTAFAGGTYSVTVNGANVNVKATATYDVSCLVEGTLIMLADGTQKAVENIVAGDKVMVFNHETGKYEAGTIWFNDHADDPAMLRNVINLEFANGAKARIAYEHGYFDLDLMRYVFIREDNMHEFIGHKFVATNYNGTEVVQSETTLVKAYITQEVVKVYGPITEYHFNLVSDDMLSMPSFNFGATGMVNIFEYDENLQYNAEKMQADIETYGVFTYEEFSEYMSYEDYCKAPIQYFKVAIGKGNLTWEQIELTLQYLGENQFTE